jgi:hypothetical protein
MPTWLFCGPKLSVFGSGYNKGEPVLVTGIYKSEDFTELMQTNEVVHRIINKDIRAKKILRLK